MRKLIYTTAIFLAAFSLNAQNFQPYDLHEQEQAYQQAMNDYYNNNDNSSKPSKVIVGDASGGCGDGVNNAFIGIDVNTGDILIPETPAEALSIFNSANGWGGNTDFGLGLYCATIEQLENLLQLPKEDWFIPDGLDDCDFMDTGGWPQDKPTGDVDNNDWRNGFGAPIGSGLLISSLLAVAYGIFSARRKRKEITN